MARSRTASFLRAALAAALVAAGALISIPLGPVPVTLQVFVLAVVVLVLAPAEASIALGLYVALGAVGAPVFSGGGSGVGVL
ncbi:MAG: biotin transporter BioY, partial [Coriobacteriia bacterium]